MRSRVEQARIELALVVLNEALPLSETQRVQTNAVRLALRVLRGHVEDRRLRTFWEVAGYPENRGRFANLSACLNGIRREAGLAPL